MHFNHVDLEYGGSAWDLRGVRLRAGVLEITIGSGLTDGMCGSDQSEDPTTDLALYLSVLDSPALDRRGPYF
jgi:hypothetical protein